MNHLHINCLMVIPINKAPFRLALYSFHTIGPLPIVIGGVSETNQKEDDITIVAIDLAVTPEDLAVSSELSYSVQMKLVIYFALNFDKLLVVQQQG